jgi:hypothetical protein
MLKFFEKKKILDLAVGFDENIKLQRVNTEDEYFQRSFLSP